MIEKWTLSRRRFNKTLTAVPLLPFSTEHVASPETQRPLRLSPGDVVRNDDGETFFIKQERDITGQSFLCRYSMDDYSFLPPPGFPKQSTYAPSAVIGAIPLKEKPRHEKGTFPFWDGTPKKYKATGGISFLFVVGLHSLPHDNTFTPVKTMLREKITDVSEGDFFDLTYTIDERKPTLGVMHTREDTLRHPDVTKQALSTQLYALKKEDPLARYWGFGHSNGSYEVLELADEHPDLFAGIVLYHGALAGAGNPYIPSAVEGAGVRFFAGEAGAFHIQRGTDAQVLRDVEEKVRRLREKGVIVITYSSTKDPFIEPRFSVIRTAQTEFPHHKITSLAPFDSYVEWDTAKEVTAQGPCDTTLCLQPDFSSTTADESARLQKVRAEVGDHGSAIPNRQVLEEVFLSLAEVYPAMRRVFSQNDFAMLRLTEPARFLWGMITESHPQGQQFTMKAFVPKDTPHFTVTLKKPDIAFSRKDAESWIKSLNIPDVSPLILSFQTDAVERFKNNILKEPYTGDGFVFTYNSRTDETQLRYTHARGRSAVVQFLASYGVDSLDEFNNLTITT